MGNPHDVASVSRPMLPGEKLVISPVSDVTHLCPPNGTVFGLLMVTNYQLIFEGSNGPSFCVPLCSIESISKVGGQSSRGETSYAIDIRTKELRAIRLAFKPENHSRRSVFEALSKFCYPAADSLLNFFAFFFQGQFKTQAGWQIYNARSEFTRQRLPATWRICTANSQYELCSTYPSVFAVPASVSDDALRNVAAFRSRGRIPVLSWIHANGASMTRCSQPRVGVAGKRNADDEAYFQTLININQTDKTKLYIVDARPKANALANQAKGLGFESEANYPRTEVLFANIHNIHAMRESLQKLRDICASSGDESRWLSDLESTLWLKHVMVVLAGTATIVEYMERGTSVLVHCSDGWDRTAQLTALSMICMDPFFRTLRGFEVLIEKEWLSFGHKFAQRIGHGSREEENERSPVFVQFIDCVWQLQQQFPCSFEFNSTFLIAILDHLYRFAFLCLSCAGSRFSRSFCSCLFGTFLYNNERERAEAQLPTRTRSLWDFLENDVSQFLNPFFSFRPEAPVLAPAASMRRIQLWSDYYLRWNADQAPKVPGMVLVRNEQTLHQLRFRCVGACGASREGTGGHCGRLAQKTPGCRCFLTCLRESRLYLLFNTLGGHARSALAFGDKDRV
eukprot:m.180787 g.180787  ORF g.180787 m.180787 type:complete len:624 (+) comp53446_c0_seq38:367-2238(+)